DIIDAEKAYRIGLVNQVVADGPAAVAAATAIAERLARGPAFAHAMTKQMLESEATLDLGDAIEAEAQAQAICMVHGDFREAHEAWRAKRPPRFQGAAVCDEGGAPGPDSGGPPGTGGEAA